MPNEVLSEEYLDLIVENVALDQFRNDYEVTYLNETYSMVHIPSQNVNMCTLGNDYEYRLFPPIYNIESMLALEDSGVIRTRRHPGFGMLGQGVLVGVVDTGIEYQHQAFLNEDNTSRIVSIWDQTINNGEVPPEGFTYGTEYSQELLNTALQSEDPLSIVPSTDENGHGTMMAGIIAGNENEEANFSGIVPDAELVVVKLKQAKQINRRMFMVPPDKLCYQETDIILGIRYIITTALRLNRPLALCIALGTNEGGHDGRGATSSYLSILSQYPRIGVAMSGGNEGNTQRHYLGLIEERQEFKEFELKVSSLDKTFCMEVWQQVPHRLAIDIISPTGEYVPRIYPRIRSCQELTFIFEPSILWVNNFIIEAESGDQLIMIRFEDPQEGIWRFRLYNLDNQPSEFHVWLPSGDFISNETYFLEANPNTTITSPGNAFTPITTTAYNPVGGGIWLSASRGYTRTNFVKPDLAAPGVNVLAPMLNNTYGVVSGTGAATAHLTGIIAMLLEWAVLRARYPGITGVAIKHLLIRGARRDMDITYPNNVWGYGKVDLFGVFEMLR